MKSEDIFISLTDIDERLIEEARPDKVRTLRKNQIKIALAAAACLCVLLIGAFNFTYSDNRYSPFSSFPEIVFNSMGYEGTDSLSLEFSMDINPYSENTLPEKLPVYQNLCYSGELWQNYFSEAELKKKATDFAKIMEEEVNSFETVYGEEEGIYNVIAQTESYQISVNGSAVSIIFKEKESANDGDINTIESLLKNYPELISPPFEIGYDSSYSVDGKFLGKEFIVYSKKESSADNILSYNLSSAKIMPSTDGGIYSIRIDDYISSSDKVTDYKTVSVETATKKLLSGENVSTSTPHELIIGGKVQKQHIKKIDLIYYTNNLQQAFVPCYRFYVKLINPDESSEIEKYGLFYVPAVEIADSSPFDVLKNIFQ